MVVATTKNTRRKASSRSRHRAVATMKTTMRITLVGPTYPYKGGVAQHTTELAFRLAEAGHDVELLSWSAQYPKRLYPGETQVAEEGSERSFDRVRRALAWNRPWTWWQAWSPSAPPPDVVVLCVVTPVQVPAYRTLVHRAHRLGATVVALCHNVEPHDGGPMSRRLTRLLLSSVDRVLTHSDAEADRARALGANEVRSHRMPLHFPVVLRPGAIDRPTHNRLLFFGFVRRYKGLDLLIEALTLTRSTPSLLAVGEFWESYDDLTALVERLGLSERVTLRNGYLRADELPAVLAASDAVVLPYRSGTGSQQPALAHAAGVPVIVTSVGDLPHRVRDGVDGIVCAPESPAELAAAIDRLYDSPDTLASLRRGIIVDANDQDWHGYLQMLLGDEVGRRARPGV